MTVFIAIAAICIIVTGGWVAVRLAPWSAPISGCVGLLVALLGVFGGSLRVMGFGAGLFVFSAVLFVLGGGMENR